jgi:hypothetical protein
MSDKSFDASQTTLDMLDKLNKAVIKRREVSASA